jgi:hypothetical protein
MHAMHPEALRCVVGLVPQNVMAEWTFVGVWRWAGWIPWPWRKKLEMF